MKEFFLFFVLQSVLYLNLTIDYRAVAHQQYALAAVTNIIAPILSWVMVKRIGTAKNETLGMVAVATAGALSTVLGMYLTRAWG